ncbi:hypothetical protein EYF80_015035 [Liparis tanakae]|uniref:Uncharacterized protein n=1 Tax=Liparis tanakae TaxID=230148 RepID=A0A4Z2I9U4_9TELE|nr:hypothetical protein EYF80_015035 [Liparis tanakae]
MLETIKKLFTQFGVEELSQSSPDLKPIQRLRGDLETAMIAQHHEPHDCVEFFLFAFAVSEVLFSEVLECGDCSVAGLNNSIYKFTSAFLPVYDEVIKTGASAGRMVGDLKGLALGQETARRRTTPTKASGLSIAGRLSLLPH